jgi:hypothetical protein
MDGVQDVLDAVAEQVAEVIEFPRAFQHGHHVITQFNDATAHLGIHAFVWVVDQGDQGTDLSFTHGRYQRLATTVHTVQTRWPSMPPRPNSALVSISKLVARSPSCAKAVKRSLSPSTEGTPRNCRPCGA